VKLHCKIVHEPENGANLLEKLSDLEKEVADQKYILSSKVLTIKEYEIKRKYVCKCKGLCQIDHKFFNWTTPKSNEI
jgi:hypothetical protein